MLNDEDLTHQLGAAFRSSTADLTYEGRRRPRRTAVAVVPLAAVGIAVAAIGVNAALSGSPTTPGAPVALGTPTASATPTARTVTEKIELAGFAMSYQRTVGEPAPVYAVEFDALPDDVTPVPLTGTDAKAWVGKDPGNGDNAVFIKAPTRNGGNLFALESASYSQDELVDIVKNGAPRTVPLVKR